MRPGLLLLFTVPLISGCSVFGINTVEEAGYQALKAKDQYELRLYDPILIAETTVEGNFDDSGEQAFQQLFRYISGNNIWKYQDDCDQPCECKSMQTSFTINLPDDLQFFVFRGQTDG